MMANLMSALHFTETDLAANREGQFSAAQESALPRKNWRPTLIQLLYSGLSFAAVIATYIIWTQLADDPIGDFNLSMNVSIGVGVLLGLFFIYRAYEVRPQLPATFEVKQVTGKVELFSGVSNSGKPMYRVRVDDPKIVIRDPAFIIPEAAFKMFKQGTLYHVYYAPGVGILSAEVA